MKKSFLILSAICAVFASCQKQDVVSNAVNSERISVSYSLVGNGAPVSKAAAASTKESTVANYQIYVFNTDGSLDASGYQSSAEAITLKCTPGDKKVYGLVNHKADLTTSINNETALLAVKSDLGDNDAATTFVMFGEKDVTLPATGTVAVPVDRLCSKIYIDKITNNLNAALGKITLNAIYVINATGDATIGDETYCPAAAGSWYNKQKYVASGDTKIEALLADNALATDIANGAAYSTPRYFYAYPNPTSDDNSDATFSPRYTRLVIDVTVENDKDASGAQVPHRYYPINLCVKSGETYGGESAATSFMGLGRNLYYHITNLKISRLGSLDPDKPVVSEDMTFSVSVNAWALGFEKEIEI